MRKLAYITLSLVASSILLLSCGDDNYSEPEETFRGKFIEKGTGKPYQTAIGNTGVRIRMMEYSWSSTPQPYDFNCMQDGTFNNDKIFKGEYGITPSGAFVPLGEEIMTIEGVVEKTYEVEPLFCVEWVGEPVVNADRTVTFSVKITHGTEHVDYKKPIAEAWLFVSETNYVGDFSYSPNYSVTVNHAQMGINSDDLLGSGGITFTVSTSQSAQAFPDYSRKYFFRFGVRSTVTFDATNRYNYTEVKEVTIP